MPTVDIQNLEKELRTIIAEIAEIESEKITLQSKFVEDLGMDSMMALEVLASIEKKYKLKIPEENLMKMTDLKSIIELARNFLEKK